MKHQFHPKVIAKDNRNDILAQILESPYTWYTPKFKHITDLIKTPADVEIMDQCLNEIIQKLSSAKVCASRQSAQNDPSDDVSILERRGQYAKRKRQQGEGR